MLLYDSIRDAGLWTRCCADLDLPAPHSTKHDLGL